MVSLWSVSMISIGKTNWLIRLWAINRIKSTFKKYLSFFFPGYVRIQKFFHQFKSMLNINNTSNIEQIPSNRIGTSSQKPKFTFFQHSNSSSPWVHLNSDHQNSWTYSVDFPGGIFSSKMVRYTPTLTIPSTWESWVLARLAHQQLWLAGKGIFQTDHKHSITSTCPLLLPSTSLSSKRHFHHILPKKKSCFEKSFR